jgi:hypothetical protein
MPKTPPLSTPTTPLPTPVPPPTLHLPLPIPGTPLPQTATPPPLPSGFGFPTRLKVRKRGGSLKWIGIALAGYFILGRPLVRHFKPAPAPSPAAVIALGDEASEADDDRIKTEVERVLENSARTKDEAIAVYVDESEVTLTGHVHDRELAQEADAMARAVPGVTDVSNEIELRAPGDHRSSVPRAQAVPALPPVPAPGMQALDSALRMVTRDLPVAELVKEGRRRLARGEPEAALEVFTSALSLDPGNKDAAAGAGEAAQQVKARAERQRRESRPRPPAPPAPDQER